MSKLLSIGAAAKTLGLSTSTLRHWEAVGRLVPVRTEGGQRRYDLAPLRPGRILLRFGAELVFAPCEARNVEVVIINRGADTMFEEDLANDVLEIITVFSARLYGSRSHRNQKLIDGMRRAAQEAQC